MPTVFNGTVGGRIFAVWCYLRFEVHDFYDGIPMLNLAASPPPPPAPTEHQIGIYIIASRFSENVRNDGKLATGFPEQFLFRIIGKIPSLDYPEKTQVSLQCLKLSGSAREARLSKRPQLVILNCIGLGFLPLLNCIGLGPCPLGLRLGTNCWGEL